MLIAGSDCKFKTQFKSIIKDGKCYMVSSTHKAIFLSLLHLAPDLKKKQKTKAPKKTCCKLFAGLREGSQTSVYIFFNINQVKLLVLKFKQLSFLARPELNLLVSELGKASP